MTAPTLDRVAARHAGVRAEILTAATDLVRSDGLAALSMRDLGARVGMRAQSVYGYFASKDELYDALFGQAAAEFLAAISVEVASDLMPADVVADMAHRYVRFCVADPVRFQLLFQRTLPGFEPSPGSYAPAVEALAHMAATFASAGIDDPQAVDLATAVITGLTSQQLANDPGGDRWTRLVDRAVRMVLAEVAPHVLSSTPPRPRRKATP